MVEAGPGRRRPTSRSRRRSPASRRRWLQPGAERHPRDRSPRVDARTACASGRRARLDRQGRRVRRDLHPLDAVGDPSLEYTKVSPTTGDPLPNIPGFQLVTDFNGDGTPDGILIGEPVLRRRLVAVRQRRAVGEGRWPPPTPVAPARQPRNSRPVEERGRVRERQGAAYGFSLGSGVLGEGLLTGLTFAGTHHDLTRSYGSSLDRGARRDRRVRADRRQQRGRDRSGCGRRRHRHAARGPDLRRGLAHRQRERLRVGRQEADLQRRDVPGRQHHQDLLQGHAQQYDHQRRPADHDRAQRRRPEAGGLRRPAGRPDQDLLGLVPHRLPPDRRRAADGRGRPGRLLLRHRHAD